MKEWSTYRIQDFLLFSQDILLEVIEAYNHDLWPWQILWLGLAVVLLLLLLFPSPFRSRLMWSLVAGGWIWVGLVFYLQYFMSINWAARYGAGLFLIEATLLVLCGVALRKIEPYPSGLSRMLGIGVFTLAAFVPIELAWGHKPAQIMIFGWGPDRTALGTLGLLLAARAGYVKWLLMLPAALWGLLAFLMYYGLK